MLLKRIFMYRLTANPVNILCFTSRCSVLFSNIIIILCGPIVYFTDSRFILHFFIKHLLCVQFYMHHNMTNINSNQLSLSRILFISAAALYSTLRCSRFLSGFRNLSLYDRQGHYSPSFLLQMCKTVFFYISLFIVSFLSRPLVEQTKLIPKCKTGIKKHIVQYARKNLEIHTYW